MIYFQVFVFVVVVVFVFVVVFVVVVVFSQLNKILLLGIIIERVAPYFSFVPNQ